MDAITDDLILAIVVFTLFALTAYASIRQTKMERKKITSINWDRLLEEIQQEPEEYDDSHVW